MTGSYPQLQLTQRPIALILQAHRIVLENNAIHGDSAENNEHRLITEKFDEDKADASTPLKGVPHFQHAY